MPIATKLDQEKCDKHTIVDNSGMTHCMNVRLMPRYSLDEGW